MPFDMNKYRQEDFKPRTAEVRVDELRQWFGDDDPVWVVRSLSAVELAKVREAVDRNGRALQALVSALVYTSQDNDGILSDIKAKKDDMVPSDIVRRYELLIAGSLSPTIEDKSDAIILGKNHPGVFYEITNKILELTGLGAEPGKQTPCGDGKTSEPH